MLRVVMSMMVLAAPPPHHDFADVHVAHVSFTSLARAFHRYEIAMRRVAPLYDPSTPPGPPFDMHYHLERLDRLRANVSSLLDESDGLWDEMLLEGDVP